MNERTAARHGWPGLFASWGVVALVMAGGCAAGDRAELQGTVTVAGTAVEKGGIMLEPIAGTKGPTAGGPVTAGRYRLTGREGVRPGSFLVRLSAVRKTGRMVASAASPGAKTEEFVDIIPPEYGRQSTVKVDIKPGVNTLDITIPEPRAAHGGPDENPGSETADDQKCGHPSLPLSKCGGSRLLTPWILAITIAQTTSEGLALCRA